MSRIEEFFEKAVEAGIIPQIPMNYDAAAYKIYTGYLENKVDELTSELKRYGLPVNVGDKVFAIWEDDIREYKVIETRFVNNTTGITWAISCISMNTNNIIQLFDCHFGVWWFTDPVKAVLRLKELQEGKK